MTSAFYNLLKSPQEISSEVAAELEWFNVLLYVRTSTSTSVNEIRKLLSTRKGQQKPHFNSIWKEQHCIIGDWRLPSIVTCHHLQTGDGNVQKKGSHCGPRYHKHPCHVRNCCTADVDQDALIANALVHISSVKHLQMQKRLHKCIDLVMCQRITIYVDTFFSGMFFLLSILFM